MEQLASEGVNEIESCTEKVTGYVPMPVGEPVISPVEEFSVSPFGKVPLETVKLELGCTGPALIAEMYCCPATAVEAGHAMTSAVNGAVTVELKLSCTLTEKFARPGVVAEPLRTPLLPSVRPAGGVLFTVLH